MELPIISSGLNVKPTSFEEAIQNPKWQQAMDKELQALIDNQTWSIILLPKGKKAIGSIKHYKARLITKGYS